MCVRPFSSLSLYDDLLSPHILFIFLLFSTLEKKEKKKYILPLLYMFILLFTINFFFSFCSHIHPNIYFPFCVLGSKYLSSISTASGGTYPK